MHLLIRFDRSYFLEILIFYFSPQQKIGFHSALVHHHIIIKQMTEAHLIHQLRSGDRISFNDFVSAYKETVLNVCYRFLMNKEDAEDVSQEVFIEVFNSIDKFKGESKLSTWMYRIAVAKSLDEIKRQQRKKRVSTAGITSGLDEIGHRLICKDRPDKRLEDKESVGLFFHALNCLPDNQRMAITLSKLDGYSNTEIARKMKTTLTAVDSLIYRAKKNFKLTLMSQLRDISRIQNSESSQSAVFNMVG